MRWQVVRTRRNRKRGFCRPSPIRPPRAAHRPTLCRCPYASTHRPRRNRRATSSRRRCTAPECSCRSCRPFRNAQSVAPRFGQHRHRCTPSVRSSKATGAPSWAAGRFPSIRTCRAAARHFRRSAYRKRACGSHRVRCPLCLPAPLPKRSARGRATRRGSRPYRFRDRRTFRPLDRVYTDCRLGCWNTPRACSCSCRGRPSCPSPTSTTGSPFRLLPTSMRKSRFWHCHSYNVALLPPRWVWCLGS